MPAYDDLVSAARDDLAALSDYARQRVVESSENVPLWHLWANRAEHIDAARAELAKIPGIGAVLAEPVRTTGSVTVKIENAYSDGRTSTSTVEVEPPEDTTVGADLTDWWSETVFDHTGDGHGIGRKLGSCYTATVIGVQHPHDNALAWMLGESFEWLD